MKTVCIKEAKDNIIRSGEGNSKITTYSEKDIVNAIVKRAEMDLLNDCEYAELKGVFSEACANNDIDSCKDISDLIQSTVKSICCKSAATYMHTCLKQIV